MNWVDHTADWLGILPEGWRKVRLRYLLDRNDSGVWGEEGGPDDILVLRSTEQTADGQWKIDDPARRALSPREKTEALLRQGDLVVTKSSGSVQHIGKTSLVDEEVAALGACFSNFMQRLRVRPPNDPRFFWHFLNQPAGREQLFYRSSTTTGLANLNGTILGSVVAPVPPPAAQKAIASFLDRETARIDTLIEKKRRLLDLLEEKRRALITRAVTRGLDPDVPLKDSGVEWIGEIPEQWDVTTLNRITSSSRPIRYGIVLPGPHEEDGVPIIKAGDVAGLNGRVGSLRRCAKEIEDNHKQSRVYPGDLVYSIRGSFGAVNRVPEKLPVANLTQDAARVVPEGVCGHWLLFMLRSEAVKRQLEAGVKGTAVKGVNIEDLRRAVIPVPPRADQKAISQYLEQQLNKLRTMRQKTMEAAKLLDEYRAAIVSAAVTGRMKVSS